MFGISNKNKEYIETKNLSSYIDESVEKYSSQRRPFERRWYDNNFFDDGYHFRFLSRQTGKIVDEGGQIFMGSPRRAIPKASRQVRGVASLLLQLEPRPVVYPERVRASLYPPIVDPNTGQQMPNPAYQEAMERAKTEARRIGDWLESEWEDEQHDMDDKLIHMIILAAKQGISFMQVWADPKTGKSASKVFDAFDIYLDGTVTSIYESPMIIKAAPMSIAKIKSNPSYDEEQRMRISADNRYASSEVKQAYMQSRYGSMDATEHNQTLILKEAFTKEYLTRENAPDIKKSNEEALTGKSYGDQVIRHAFSTSNGTLKDEYLTLPEYPWIDFRFEPGQIYQVPLIERFIPANKSLDIAVSRVEGFTNTMVTGIYQKRKGENFKISNIPGGQLIEYEATPLTQMQPASIPAFVFNFISLLEKTIEEQGASTSTLGRLPEGVRSGVAIESIKATEYANLIIPTKMYKKTVKRIASRFIEMASENITDPTEVASEVNGQSVYFDVIGEAGVRSRKAALMETPPDWAVIKPKMKVRIEIDSGLGYTMEGKKATMQQVADYILRLAEAGYVSSGQVQLVIQRFLEIFKFGSTSEFMDAMGEGSVDITGQQIDQMKIAILEVLKDTGMVGDAADERGVETTKVGMMEVAKDMGVGSEAENEDPLGLFT